MRRLLEQMRSARSASSASGGSGAPPIRRRPIASPGVGTTSSPPVRVNIKKPAIGGSASGHPAIRPRPNGGPSYLAKPARANTRPQPAAEPRGGGREAPRLGPPRQVKGDRPPGQPLIRPMPSEKPRPQAKPMPREDAAQKDTPRYGARMQALRRSGKFTDEYLKKRYNKISRWRRSPRK